MFTCLPLGFTHSLTNSWSGHNQVESSANTSRNQLHC